MNISNVIVCVRMVRRKNHESTENDGIFVSFLEHKANYSNRQKRMMNEWTR